MNEKLVSEVENIVMSASMLLGDNLGDLNSNQLVFAERILSNAESFLASYSDMHDLEPEELRRHIRHTLGNALTPIRGYSELLKRPGIGRLNQIQAQLVDSICTSTERLVLTMCELGRKRPTSEYVSV